MNDQHGYPIIWSEPRLQGASLAWDGPAPDAPAQPATTGQTSAPARIGGGLSGAWFAASSAVQEPHDAPSAPAAQAPVSRAESHAGPDASAGASAGVAQPSNHAAEPASAPAPEGERDVAYPAYENAPEGAPASSAAYPTNPPAQSSEGTVTGGSSKVSAQQLADAAAADASPVASNDAVAPAAAPAASELSSDHDDDRDHDTGRAPERDSGWGWNDPESAEQNPHIAADAPAADPVPAQPLPTHPEDDASAPEPAAGEAYSNEPPQVVANNDDLSDEALTIGRSRDNSIVLDDMLVSRRHVMITADDEGLLLRDVGSRNGTYVNGKRVEQTHLEDGDRIGIGASTFEVQNGWLVSI